jgi:hypothetical protein
MFRRSMAAIALVAFLSIPAVSSADNPVHDRTLGTWLNFAGLRMMIDSIQSVASPDGNTILSQVNTQDSDKGYLIITIDMQNPSSDDIGMPGLQFGFELADGSQVNVTDPFGPYVGAGVTAAPDPLHPKQHLKVRYVAPNWPGTEITKMFMVSNGGGADSGDKNDRFQIKKGDIQVLTPVPTPTPT